MKIYFFGALLLCAFTMESSELSMRINKKYINFPISHSVDRKQLQMSIDGEIIDKFQIRLSNKNIDYWVYRDVSEYMGKEICFNYESDKKIPIFQSDTIVGHSSLYSELNRPQFHYTSKRGWMNDPNGLVYLNGEYHLFYQHNPYEREWGNMSWGHAVSKDLLHWEELDIALRPDEFGTMFSGSAVVDYNNTSGFGTKENPPLVAIYTADSREKQVQCLAYSLDSGRTWMKYENNPVIDSHEMWNSHDTRDPKVFWYSPNNHWVMILHERDGHSIYTSSNLKDWIYRSHITGFWECPEFFPLSVDGMPGYEKWVMLGASGCYMLGDFNGYEFIPETGKHYYLAGNKAYAAQTFNNIPEADGRRIQMSWGRIQHPDMPFRSMMSFPTELTLRKTKDGVRLFNCPIRELDNIQHLIVEHPDTLTGMQANDILKEISNLETFRLKAIITLSHSTSAGLKLGKQTILNYDIGYSKVNDTFYSPEKFTSMSISVDVLVDRTSVEIFVDNGALTCMLQRTSQEKEPQKITFWGNRIAVSNLELYKIESIW